MFQGVLLLRAEAPSIELNAPPWNPGPLQLLIPGGGGQVTDAATRSTYYDRRAGQVLYGTGPSSTRHHLALPEPVEVLGPLRLIAVERLSIPSLRIDSLLALHLDAEPGAPADETLARWGELSRWKRVRSGPTTISRALQTALGDAPVALTPSSGDPYRVSFLSQVQPRSPQISAADVGTDRRIDEWLLALAIGSVDAARDLSEDERRRLLATRIALSADWSALVLRDGAGLLGHARSSSDFVEKYAPVYFRSIYLDALILGRLQQLGLRALTDELVDLSDPALHPRKVERLAARMSHFRNELWWQHLTEHGVANDLLVAMHRQHRLPELVEQVRSELSDYSQQASLRAGRVLNVLVALFAVIGLLGTGVEIYRLFRVDEAIPERTTLFAVMVSVVLLAGVTIAAASGRPMRWVQGRDPR